MKIPLFQKKKKKKKKVLDFFQNWGNKSTKFIWEWGRILAPEMAPENTKKSLIVPFPNPHCSP